jgi:ATP-dependent protease HslVU (ClpYQ) peptidase subunit
MMVADTQCSDGGMRVKATKIIRVRGDLIGIAGNLEDLYIFKEWYGSDEDIDLEDSVVLVLTKKGRMFTYEGRVRIPVADKFYAIGTGASAAMAAMHMGACPKKAVSIAKKVDVNTGGPIIVRKI